jgi:hypothetical protein
VHVCACVGDAGRQATGVAARLTSFLVAAVAGTAVGDAVAPERFRYAVSRKRVAEHLRRVDAVLFAATMEVIAPVHCIHRTTGIHMRQLTNKLSDETVCSVCRRSDASFRIYVNYAQGSACRTVAPRQQPAACTTPGIATARHL